MEGILAIVMIFGLPVFILATRGYFRLREKELLLRAEQDPKRIQACEREIAQLEARLQNLETIVCTSSIESARTEALPPPAGNPSNDSGLTVKR